MLRIWASTLPSSACAAPAPVDVDMSMLAVNPRPYTVCVAGDELLDELEDVLLEDDVVLFAGAVSAPAGMPRRAKASESVGPGTRFAVTPGLTVIFSVSPLAP